MYSMKTWQDRSFDSYFDFQDFDCREFTVDTSCAVRNADFFDITTEFDVSYTKQTEDEYEALYEFLAIDFKRILTDEFYDFTIFYKGDYDTFDFKTGFNFSNEINILEDFVFSMGIYWKEAPEEDDTFSFDFKNYVLYTNDQTSFYIEKGNSYQLFLEDDFDGTLIIVESIGTAEDSFIAKQ